MPEKIRRSAPTSPIRRSATRATTRLPAPRARRCASWTRAESWEWWLCCWAKVLDACGVTGADRAFFAFSFAPFIGFWSAFDAVSRRGALTVPGGGADSSRRLRILLDTGCTALFCTPTYALHLAETARREGIDLAASSVRCAVLAGEPGGSIPAVRQRIAEAWGAVPYDHAGASEIGAYGIPCPQGPRHVRQRRGVHRGSPRPGDPGARGRGRDRRVGADQPRPLGLPGDPLSNGRYRAPAQSRRGVAIGRGHSRALRRDDPGAQRQPLSRGHRGG